MSSDKLSRENIVEYLAGSIPIIFSLFFLNVNAAEKQDCSVLKKLSKDYWICKKNNLKEKNIS